MPLVLVCRATPYTDFPQRAFADWPRPGARFLRRHGFQAPTRVSHRAAPLPALLRAHQSVLCRTIPRISRVISVPWSRSISDNRALSHIALARAGRPRRGAAKLGGLVRRPDWKRQGEVRVSTNFGQFNKRVAVDPIRGLCPLDARQGQRPLEPARWLG